MELKQEIEKMELAHVCENSESGGQVGETKIH